MRDLVKLRQAFKYFISNKYWILSALYICAVIKDCVWYSMFGINILSYISIQETLLSFLNHTLIFVVLILNYLLFQLIFSKGGTWLQIIKWLVVFAISFLFFNLFKKPISFSMIVALVSFFSYELRERRYHRIMLLGIIFILAFSTIEPLTQGLIIKANDQPRSSTQFAWNESNMDYYSFTYNGAVIDTNLDRYYLIGNTKDYFFIYDRLIKKALVIDKTNCSGIQATFNFL